MTNKEFAEINEDFQEACEHVELKSTTRQASKWRMRKGLAWKEGRKQWPNPKKKNPKTASTQSSP